MSANTNNKRQDVVKRALLELRDLRGKLNAAERAKREPIAVVGIGCRLPGDVDSPAAFWRLLENGVDATREIPADRWDVDAYYDPDPAAPGKMYTRRGGFLESADKFDPRFFNIPPREATTMDPQHRLFLEVCWEALENANIPPDTLTNSKTGVFLGITATDYAQLYLKYNDPSEIDAYISTGNPINFATGRVSYVLGLQGPSVALDTACSSSLVSVHLACQSLRQGDCNAALAGGVNLLLLPETMVTLSKARMLAPDGRCKTFDASADGYARGEGCGVIVLKRLSDAQAAGDDILAVIRGSAVNQDGPSSGVTVPNGQAQQALIQTALNNAGMQPDDIDYVEAHGTGTSLGDPIELRALSAALGKGRTADNPLIVGSLKTNLGHLESAAGIAGLIKLILSVKNGVIPPHLNFNNPNPHLDWRKLPIEVPTRRMAWPNGGAERVAGISSFGASGTNAHVIVAAAPTQATVSSGAHDTPQTVLLSGKNDNALRESAERYAEVLAVSPLADVAYTSQIGRTHLKERLAIVGNSAETVQAQLRAYANGDAAPAVLRGTAAGTPKTVFLFTGQGSQYADMGKALYEQEPVFRAAIDECDRHLRPLLAQPLLRVLYPTNGTTSPIDQTAYTQPALFALEYALAKLWQSWGVTPSVVLGHSVGEYVAACVAGVFSLEDGLKLIAARGRLMQALPSGGAMAAVFAAEANVAPYVQPFAASVSIAATNNPTETVISGVAADIETIVAQIEAAGLRTKRLRVSHAFHSPLMEPMLAAFARVAQRVTYHAPQLKLVSNVTAQFADAAVTTPDYWVEHVRATVRFQASLQMLLDAGYRHFVELGPRPVLSSSGKRIVAQQSLDVLLLPSLRPKQADAIQIRLSMAQLHLNGVRVDWAATHGARKPRKVTLPTYPFQRQRYWINTDRPASRAVAKRAGTSLLGERIASPLQQRQYQTIYSLDSSPLIHDHRIYGHAIMPGIVYIEMGLAAMEEMVSAEAFSLEKFVVHQPLILTEQSRVAGHFVVTPTDDAGEFAAYSQADDGEWRLHSTGLVTVGASTAEPTIEPTVDLMVLQDRMSGNQSGADFYSNVWHPDFQLGKSFHYINHVWTGNQEALGLLELPSELRPQLATQGVRPELVILDACVQLMIAALPADALRGAVFVGRGQQFTRVYHPLPDTPLWCHAVLQETQSGESITGDIYLFDQSGRLLAEFGSVSYHRLQRQTLDRMAGAAQPAQVQRARIDRATVLAADSAELQTTLLLDYLVATLGAIMGMDAAQIEPTDQLIMLVDSLMAIELKNAVDTDLELAVPMEQLLDGTDIATLAGYLRTQILTDAPTDETPQTMTVAEMTVAAQLADDIRPDAPFVASDPQTILLTGATGFIGGFLLHELLAQSSAEIICLVRAADEVAALERLRTNLAAYHLAPAAWERVTPLVGDLAQPQLGLTNAKFAQLTQQVDLIWHCGALVKWTFPYAALKAANVDGTEALLRLACHDHAKPFHFVSTVGVFSGTAFTSGQIDEQEPLANSGALTVGYAQSKWVSEKMVRLAGERGLPIAIYRPNTGGDSQTGRFNPNDHVPLLLKGCIQLGSAPQDLGMLVQAAPIDFAARAMIALSLQTGSLGKTFHIVNPNGLTWEAWLAAVAANGFSLDWVTYAAWRAQLAAQVAQGADNALYALAPFFSESLLAHVQLPLYACDNVLQGLANTDIVCPPLDQPLLETYFNYFVESGYLPRPSALLTHV